MRKLTKEQEQNVRRAAKALRATGDTRNIIVANNLRGGLKLVNYLFETQRKVDKLVPPGFEIEPIAITPKTTKAKGHAVAAQWLIVTIMERLRANNVETASQVGR